MRDFASGRDSDWQTDILTVIFNNVYFFNQVINVGSIIFAQK